MVSLLVLLGVLAFGIAYFTYAKILGRIFGLKPDRPTPAHTQQDGRDYFPAPAPMLLGHHFSSIAGAGPIVGPVFATLVFGWAPSVVWIIVGSIFIGGVHDFGSLAVSIRSGAHTIVQVARRHIGRATSKLLLTFVWLTLVYVLVVFLNLTAATFAPQLAEGTAPELAERLLRRGGGVATSSLIFILLAIGLGATIYRAKVPLGRASLFFVPLVFAGVYAGQHAPLLPQWLPTVNGSVTASWSLLLIGYCFIASITPVWILLQPRDYLSSFLLYACLALGLAGILVGPMASGHELPLRYPAFLGFHSEKLGYLFPALFITIACGACSGFHSIVASGTTAKQLNREQDARLVGYGSMLLEGLLALVAVSTVAILARDSAETKLPPPALFAAGFSRFLGLLGIPLETGNSFGLLALSTFLLTTLDTATRLGRYLLEELLELRRHHSRWISTGLTLALPLAFSLMTFHDSAGQSIPVWKLIWPVFGATNQLLGGLALLLITIWLRRAGRPIWPTLLPMVFMIAATLIALLQLCWQNLRGGVSLVGSIALLLLLLALVVIGETIRALLTGEAAAETASRKLTPAE